MSPQAANLLQVDFRAACFQDDNEPQLFWMKFINIFQVHRSAKGARRKADTAVLPRDFWGEQA